MLSLFAHYFTVFVYQPFFNILIAIYYILDQATAGEGDMGITVIIFAVVVRIILLPMSLSGDKSAAEKRAISETIHHINKTYAHDPERKKKERRRVMKSNPVALISEGFSVLVQLVIVLMLYRIFKTGLEGADMHLLYSFMPDIKQPVNMLFLGQYDLSRPSMTLNFIQSFLIFILESFSMLFSPYPVSRRDFISLGLAMPFVSFFIFLGLPAGKKVFIITTLIFSICLLLIKQLVFWYDLVTSRAAKTAPDAS